MIDVTIGICAYNEEGNIGQCIRSIYSQDHNVANVKEVIVVLSGCTDNSESIVRELQKEYDNIRIIVQPEREGKNSAINAYLDANTCDIVVMLNADNIFGTPDSLDKLVEPFTTDPNVGIVGGRPIPTNDPKDKIGYVVNMMWLVHHNVALRVPKIGELVAFRDIGVRLRTDLQSDEDIIRMELERAGYTCKYVPDSIIRNRGPETEEDYIKQRVRVNVGEYTVKKIYGYDIPTWNKSCLVKATLKSMFDLGFHPFKLLYTVRLELRCRKIAMKHVESGGDLMNIWDRVDSTKIL